MTALDALHASDRIRDHYRRYLQATFPIQDTRLGQDLQRELDGGFTLTKGPYLQASPPFEQGLSIRDLVDEGLLSDGFLRFKPHQFPIDRSLHLHQEQALRKAVGGKRNLVVATGTGSGKTECFLLPIVDQLLREKEAGTLGQPGVRALLLYPMNALANDQIKRLRGLLEGEPAITFGRYTGETKNDAKKAMADFQARHPSGHPMPNELLSREAMQATPPHILLTNYAMLEYLLLRRADSSFFDGETGEYWRNIVLDEVHVYGGAQGAEVAMLLRRLRDRLNQSTRGRLQCFGTSATLGSGVDDYDELTAFASALFDEPFEWDADDPSRQDVVGATQRPLVQGTGTGSLSDEQIRDLLVAVDDGQAVSELAELVGVPSLSPSETLGQFLVRLLVDDQRVVALQTTLAAGSAPLEDLVKAHFPGVEGRRTLVALVQLAILARDSEDAAPLLPARYHLFLRALEGAFVCLHPEHDDDSPALLLSRHDACPSCATAGIDARMFELAACRRCGTEYLIGAKGKTPGGVPALVSASVHSENPVRALLRPPLSAQDDDDDEVVIGGAGDSAIPAVLCPACGAFAESSNQNKKPCGCSCKPREMWIAKRPQNGTGESRKCIACGSRGAGDPVSRFETGVDAPVAVIATDLYQEVPPSSDRRAASYIGEGRKLLSFSDSRQDAAFFASYIERSYGRILQRRLLVQAVDQTVGQSAGLGDLAVGVRTLAERALVLEPDAAGNKNMVAVRTWLMLEALALDRRLSLEGTGVLELRLEIPASCEPPAPLLLLGFTETEAMTLIRVLLNTVRTQGAVASLDGVDLTDEVFAPRNRSISIRQEASDRGARILAWASSPGSNNSRLDFVRRVFAARGVEADPREVLLGLWRMLADDSGPWSKLLRKTTSKQGVVFQLDPERITIRRRVDSAPVRCGRCRQLWWETVSGVCPSYRCEGTTTPIADYAALLENHYAQQYQHLEPAGLRAEEHTAQWQSIKASEIQDNFVAGKVNVLSCSTTFEMGVDVGDVQAVLLRNVPPSPANYVQRAGRAGRRTDSAALVVTYAQRRSHDLSYFEDPSTMVDGTIAPPRIVLENAAIVRRHLHSLAFAAFQRQAGSDTKTVEGFFSRVNDQPSRSDEMVDWLRTQPGELGLAASRVVPQAVHDELGLTSWSWVEALVAESDDEPSHGWLRRAIEEVRGDEKSVADQIEEAVAEGNYARAAALKGIWRTVGGKQLLSFLGSRNVLPKYGFPVDVVELSLRSGSGGPAAELELTRDLRMAISDYAPGATTVAGKRLWESVGLVRRADREWPLYGWATCDNCNRFRHALGGAPTECSACQSAETSAGGSFLSPTFGFVGRESNTRPGETRPKKRANRNVYFGSYRDAEPDFEPIPALNVDKRYSRQGLIAVIEEGAMSRGFLICEWCGWGQPGHQKRPAEHAHPTRLGKKCSGPLKHTALGHQFLTDVLELRPSAAVASVDLRSGLAALMEAAPALDVSRSDIDGTINYTAVDRPSFVLYDDVPGGAGHVRRLGDRLPELIAAAVDRVSDCECGEETSCYSCLRGYSNQIHHEELSRIAALRVLAALQDGTGSRSTTASPLPSATF